MTTTVIVNGNTYTDDSDPNTGMGAGGFRTRFMPMVSDVMGVMSTDVAAVNAGAASAAVSAASALAAPGTTGTSTTSATIATGALTITIQTGKTIVVGSSFKIASTASPSNWMFGDVTAYNSGTGVLTVSVTRIQGSGTFAAWTASLSGPAYADGAIGGSFSSTLSADLALNSSSPKMLTLFSGVAAGWAAVMPDATTLAAGPNAMAVAHGGSAAAGYPCYDIVVKDHSSNLLGFLQPIATASVHLADNTSVAGSWKFGNISPIGTLAANKITLASACGGTGGTWTKNVTIDSTHTLILIYGTSLHAVVYDSGAKAFGAPVLLRATLSTTGVDATVAAVLVAANSVLVHSVQDGTTALQSIVLSTSGTTITPGAVVPTTLSATASRIVDLITVGSTYVLGYMNGTTSIHVRAATVSGTVPTIGSTESSVTTVGPPAMMTASTTVFTIVTITASVLTASTYNVSVGANITPNLTTTTAVSTVDSFAMRLVSTGNWCVTYILSGVVKGTVLKVTTGSPAFGTPVSLSSVVTTINTGGAVMNLSAGSTNAVSSAVSGTDSSGHFVTEFCGWGDSVGTPGTPVLITGGIIAKGFAAAQTAMALANIANLASWVVTSAKETVLYSFLYTSTNLLMAETRTNAVDNSTQGLSIPDPLYPKINVARNTFSSVASGGGINNTIGVTDGSQISLRYSGTYYSEILALPVNAYADMRFGSKVAGTDAQAWVAFNQAPDLGCVVQLLGVV